MSQSKIKLPGTHYRITTPWDCDCILCKAWQLAQNSLEGFRKETQNPPSKEKLAAERRSLVAELRLDFFSELCFYAKEEKWKPGWGQKAWEIIKKDEKTWVMQLQYVSMEEWLGLFVEYQRG